MRMRLPVPGPRVVMSALERGGDEVEALLGAVPRALGLLDTAETAVPLAKVPGMGRIKGRIDEEESEDRTEAIVRQSGPGPEPPGSPVRPTR